MAYHIHHSFTIEASKQAVFEAVTLPKHLDNWWTLKSSGEPKLNAEYNLNFTDAYNWYCKVSEVKDNESFYLKMTQSDADWDATTFGFRLKEVEKGTLMEFEHKNWQENNHHYRHSSFCWAMLLKGLKDYLEKGTVIPFEERN